MLFAPFLRFVTARELRLTLCQWRLALLTLFYVILLPNVFFSGLPGLVTLGVAAGDFFGCLDCW